MRRIVIITVLKYSAIQQKHALLDDSINSYISPLINYDTKNSEKYAEVPADNRFSVKALYRLSFHWRVTENEYLSRVIDGLKTLGFFDVSE